MEYKNKIFNADCLSGLKEIPDNIFDVVLTSPPYGEKGKGEFQINNPCGTHRKYKAIEQHFGQDWLDWQIKIIDQCLRTCKKWVVYNIGCMAHMRAYIYAHWALC